MLVRSVLVALLLVVTAAPGEAPAQDDTSGASPSTPEVTRVAVLQVAAEDLPAFTLQLLTQSLTAGAARAEGVEVIDQSDIDTMLTLETQKQLLGCNEDTSCLAEIAGALDVQQVVGATVTRLGDRYTAAVRLVDVQASRVLARATRHTDEEARLASLMHVLGSEVMGIAPEPGALADLEGKVSGAAGQNLLWRTGVIGGVTLPVRGWAELPGTGLLAVVEDVDFDPNLRLHTSGMVAAFVAADALPWLTIGADVRLRVEDLELLEVEGTLVDENREPILEGGNPVTVPIGRGDCELDEDESRCWPGGTLFGVAAWVAPRLAPTAWLELRVALAVGYVFLFIESIDDEKPEPNVGQGLTLGGHLEVALAIPPLEGLSVLVRVDAHGLFNTGDPWIGVQGLMPAVLAGLEYAF